MESDRPEPLSLASGPEDRRHTILDQLEALTNLIYLIGIEADRPKNIRSYVETAAGCLKALSAEVTPGLDLARYSH